LCEGHAQYGLIGEKNLWIVKPGTLLYMCPHTTIYVSAYYYICVRILLLCVDRQGRTLGSRQTRFSALYVSAYCVLILCPHTTIYVSSYYCICVLILLCVLVGETNSWISSSQVLCYYVSAYCVLILLQLCCSSVAAALFMCPHTASSYCYVCVRILLHMCPHTAVYVSSHCYICVLILLYICPHTTMIRSRKVEEVRYVHVCIYTNIYMYIYTQTHTYIYTHIHQEESRGAAVALS
jgi:hypothetical protein